MFRALILSHMLCMTLLSICMLVILTEPSGTQAVPLLIGEKDVEYKRYCSNQLSEAIRLICGGNFNSHSNNYPDSVGARFTGALKGLASDDSFHRPLQNGPIHECCRRPCGYAELKAYCADTNLTNETNYK